MERMACLFSCIRSTKLIGLHGLNEWCGARPVAWNMSTDTSPLPVQAPPALVIWSLVLGCCYENKLQFSVSSHGIPETPAPLLSPRSLTATLVRKGVLEPWQDCGFFPWGQPSAQVRAASLEPQQHCRMKSSIVGAWLVR